MLKSLDGSLANVSVVTLQDWESITVHLQDPDLSSLINSMKHAGDVSNILSKRSKLAQLNTPVSIKPDLNK